ncbi:hypothetical protein [Paenibacillus lactis]|uniref:hypothetical protein n=1 Tax=Paenibacillus lactis TaxID=228574 RepID=UPI0021B62BD6
MAQPPPAFARLRGATGVETGVKLDLCRANAEDERRTCCFIIRHGQWDEARRRRKRNGRCRDGRFAF